MGVEYEIHSLAALMLGYDIVGTHTLTHTHIDVVCHCCLPTSSHVGVALETETAIVFLLVCVCLCCNNDVLNTYTTSTRAHLPYPVCMTTAEKVEHRRNTISTSVHFLQIETLFLQNFVTHAQSSAIWQKDHTFCCNFYFCNIRVHYGRCALLCKRQKKMNITDVMNALLVFMLYLCIICRHLLPQQ
jgi:hypothetical protein